MLHYEDNSELAKKELDEEFERFCGSYPEDCSGCKYEHCLQGCELCYILDNFTLKRRGKEYLR